MRAGASRTRSPPPSGRSRPSIDTPGLDRFPFVATDALRQQGFTLRDSDQAFIPARAIKLPIEIPHMREAMRRVEEGVHRLESAIEPGKTENEVWAEFWFDFLQKDGQILTTRLFQSGPHTFPYFHETSSRALQAGELLCLDTDAQGFQG
jgi:Xaa-Pro dipeptidase